MYSKNYLYKYNRMIQFQTCDIEKKLLEKKLLVMKNFIYRTCKCSFINSVSR